MFRTRGVLHKYHKSKVCLWVQDKFNGMQKQFEQYNSVLVLNVSLILRSNLARINRFELFDFVLYLNNKDP